MTFIPNLLSHLYEFWSEGKEYPNTSCEYVHVPPPFPIPRCDHGEETHVKQSRHLTMATRAYYCCCYKSVSIIWYLWFWKTFFTTPQSASHFRNQDMCRFFQWIEGPEKWNPQILLFPYDRTESSSYRTFKRWVPSPPNPPPMADEVKDEATTRCVCNTPLCKCEYCLELANPPTGLDYTHFWHRLIPLLVIIHKRK
jgi:hypothetical protein